MDIPMIPPPAMAMEGDLDWFKSGSWAATVALSTRFADTSNYRKKSRKLRERSAGNQRHHDLMNRFE
jgi:hypothetical protein